MKCGRVSDEERQELGRGWWLKERRRWGGGGVDVGVGGERVEGEIR